MQTLRKIMVAKELSPVMDIPDNMRSVQDNLEQADAAEKILLSDEGCIPLEVVAEIVFVLQKVYEVKRSLIAKNLKDLVRIREDLIFEKDIVLYAANIYSSTSLDFF